MFFSNYRDKPKIKVAAIKFFSLRVVIEYRNEIVWIIRWRVTVGGNKSDYIAWNEGLRCFG